METNGQGYASNRAKGTGAGASPAVAPAGNRTRTAVLIVDDHKLFAEAIHSTLKARDIDVLPIATTGTEACDLAASRHPKVVLMDVALPDESGLTVGRRLLEDDPEVRVIALTALNDPRVAAEAIRLGFSGFLTKDTPVWEFVNAVKAALNGSAVLSSRLTSAIYVHDPEEDQAALLGSHLTTRECEVLELLVEGARSSAIAEILSISRNTLRSHIQNILTKLQVHSRLEAAAFATRHEIVKRKRRRI